jgi:hypothetical protein
MKIANNPSLAGCSWVNVGSEGPSRDCDQRIDQNSATVVTSYLFENCISICT